MKTCKDCRHYKPQEDPEAKNGSPSIGGLCFRYPPGINSLLLPVQQQSLSMVQNQQSLEVRHYPTRPPVRSDELACGEFDGKNTVDRMRI